MSPPNDVRRPRSTLDALLARVERLGNLLPDPTMLFVFALAATWAASHLLAGRNFEALDPATGQIGALLDPRTSAPLAVHDQLQPSSLVAFFTGMVKTFVNFPPLGVVLLALLGVGVAEHTGLIGAALKSALSVTPRSLLTPMLLLVAIFSHTAADVGFVLVIPLGGVIFQAAGRHPLAGVAAAFAGVSGGYSANPLLASLDPMLQGFTQGAAQILEPSRQVSAACNWYFTAASTLVIVGLGWFITDRIVEPRVRGIEVDGDAPDPNASTALTRRERLALVVAALVAGLAVLALVAIASPASSPLREAGTGSLTNSAAPLMGMIVPLIFLIALTPALAYGVVSGTVKSHRDVIAGMTKSMSSMGYYIVMAFFCSLFLDAFVKSNLGALLALKGAGWLRALGLAPQLTVLGIIGLTAVVNLLIGSASAKWGLLSPIFVPMLMQLGLSPELTQAAYRVGDSTTNIISPLMPYFPLVVVYCTRHVRKTGIGTLISMMLPYSLSFICAWSLFLLGFWALGIPLGPGSPYTHP